jgi:hypothetical protein
MYSSILEAISQQSQIQDVDHYLQNLQPYLRYLRQSFKNSYVRVDYSDFNVQAAYLLVYYPLYVEMTCKILGELSQNLDPFSQMRNLQACLLGGGPAPEAVALSIYFRENGFQTQSFTAHTFDIAATTWSRSREVSKYLISNSDPEIQFSLHGHPVNLCERNVLPPLRDIIQTSELFIVQNCLNEFVNNPQVFVENINFLAQEMPAGSILIIADLNHYQVVKDLMKKVELCLTERSNLQIIRGQGDEGYRLRTRLPLPGVIAKNLLLSGGLLTPKVWVNFNYLAIQKLPIAVQRDYATLPF